MTCSAAQRKRNLSTNWVEHAEEHHRSARRPQKGQRRFSTTPAPVEEAPKGKPVPAWQQDSKEAASIYDVVADKDGHAMLLPLSGGEAKAVADMPENEPVTIRVFRFFEDKADEKRIWERELRNVNSGSLQWLLVHLAPKMHSVSGAKYGKWFTAHHVRVLPKHLTSGYFMCEEGACPLAKTFGATTSAVKSLVSGEKLDTGYFWFASPDRHGDGPSHKDVADDECLEQHGWQHLGRQGLFDGDLFLAKLTRTGSTSEATMSQVLRDLSPEN